MVFYFTATGNSLYVAEQLDQNAQSIAQVIHQKDLTFQDDQIGIVCPIFGHEVPPMVRAFMQNAHFVTDYFYMILTYGNRHGGAAQLAAKLARRCGMEPAYINTILMADNFLPVFDMEKQKAMDKNVDGQIAAVCKDLKCRKRWIQPATLADRLAHRGYVASSKTPPDERWKGLYVCTDGCNGCGTCTKVCPAGCWHLADGRAQYSADECQGCMACIHACPQKAIRLTIPEKNPQARYRNAQVTLAQIIAANNQNV